MATQAKMSAETFDFACTACSQNGKTLKGVKYCVECCGYCCQSCTDTHKWFPILKNHNLMEVGQGNLASGQPSSLPEFPTERCSKHTGKVLDMYCEGHDAIGCYVCFAKDHKSCQESQIHSIPDMIDTLFKLSECKQAHSLLKEMIVSMESVVESKDGQLQSLNESKKEALDKVTTFQKALEAIVRKAADASRQQVEAAYTDLENELLEGKHNAEDIREDLQTTDEKLHQSEGNSAQRFVCTKLAEEKLKDAERKKTKYELQDTTDVEISFNPDQDFMEYIKAVQGIGQVQRLGKRKRDLYKVKREKDINIQLSDEARGCSSYGCCLTPDNQLLVTDYINRKLKRIDVQKMSVVDFCTLDASPNGVCCISKHEVAVACQDAYKIKFVSIHDKMIPTRQMEMSHYCHGIAFNGGKLYVKDDGASLYVYDMTGTLLKTISPQDKSGNKLLRGWSQVNFNESGNRMFVGGGSNGVVCFDGMGNYLSTVTDTDLRGADGVCLDGRGNVFIVGRKSFNVVQFSENGEKIGTVVKKVDMSKEPSSMCFHKGLNRLFVTMVRSNVVEMYELE